MAIDLDNRHPMYLLGRLVAALEGPFPKPEVTDRMIGGTLDNLLSRPAKALPLVLARFPDHVSNSEAGNIMALLPPDLPPGPIKVEQQSYYWTGYYHQRGHQQGAIRASKKGGLQEAFTPEVIARVGNVLFGEQWQSEMARALQLGDRARAGSWMTSNQVKRRSPSVGVCWDLLAMLRQKSAEARALADEIGAMAVPNPEAETGD